MAKKKKHTRSKNAPNSQPRNRTEKTEEQEDAIANAVDTGFKNIDRTPAKPTLEPGHLKAWKRPDFPTDNAIQYRLFDIFKEKLLLVRNAATEEIKQNDTETEKHVLRRKKTAENPVAMLLADPKQPMPISFQVQDVLRNYLYENSIIHNLENASAEEKKTKSWKWESDVAIQRRDNGWDFLVESLQMQLPGEEDYRREQIVHMLQDIL